MSIAAAFKAELEKLLQGELTVASARKIADLAMAAGNALMVVPTELSVGSVVAELPGGVAGFGATVLPGLALSGPQMAYGALAPSLPSETYGARIIQEILAVVPRLMQERSDSTEGLVRALGDAKDAGLTNITEAIERRLAQRLNLPTGSVSAPTVAMPELPKPVAAAPPKLDGVCLPCRNGEHMNCLTGFDYNGTCACAAQHTVGT